MSCGPENSHCHDKSRRPIGVREVAEDLRDLEREFDDLADQVTENEKTICVIQATLKEAGKTQHWVDLIKLLLKYGFRVIVLLAIGFIGQKIAFEFLPVFDAPAPAAADGPN
ncbi:hypothetical protein [Rosistilla oblonga]|uniref:hypothetical protein n=1 Tax=Rosistilla oblonga TaxID=2527990 RepID=UPI003A96C1B6